MAQILILEEDKRHYQLIKQSVEPKGHKILWATRSAEAISFLENYLFDMVISGVNLESEDIFEFVRLVKSKPNLEQMPIVLCCADQSRIEKFASDAVCASGLTIGVSKYILLPDFAAHDKLWEDLKECFPQNMPAKDVLGGNVTTYSLSNFSWTKQQSKAS